MFPVPAVTVLPHDPQWAASFAQERVVLERALAPWLAGGVQHIGSTAVPGLAAKPMIDMMAGVADLAAAAGAAPVLAGLGWEQGTHRPQEALWFGRPAGPWWQRTHHLHLTEVGSALWRERLVFRDALRADPALRDAYAALKASLGHLEVEPYTAGKRAFVAQVLAAHGVALAPRPAAPGR